jgi:dTDP-4-amino-4,6-dideoxygalactose transaminase
MIPVSSPKHQYLKHRPEIDAAILRVLESGWYVLGTEVQAFEQEFAAYCGVGHAIGVANGTDALAIALRGMGIGPGDEVVTTALTAIATISAIEMAGATPVAVDVDPGLRTLDPSCLKAAISPKTKAVIPVHIYGQSADMDAILNIAAAHGLLVLEDCAQAAGARFGKRMLGSIGNAGSFSFYPTKNLGAIGDGGMVVTDDAELAASIRQLRQYGWNDARESLRSGVNSRLDELQAAILRAKLGHLNADNARRRDIADVYDAALADTGIPAPTRRDNAEHAFHLYAVQAPDRERLREHLTAHGIGTGIHYPTPVHLEPGYRGRLGNWPRPAAETLCREILSLPLYPELTDGEVEQVTTALAGFRAI